MKNKILILPMLIFKPVLSFAFRGPDPCDYNDCSQGYGGGVGVFSFLILIFCAYYFYKSENFRKTFYFFAILIVVCGAAAAIYFKIDKALAIVLMIAFVLLKNKIYDLIFKDSSGD